MEHEMSCRTCGNDIVPADAEYCPQCGVHLPLGSSEIPGQERGRIRSAADSALGIAAESIDALKKASRLGLKGARTAAKVGLEKTTQAIDVAQETVTQSDAFEAFNDAMEEMTMVVSVQHARIADLERRVAELERRSAATEATDRDA
jgi:hypothetical protein